MGNRSVVRGRCRGGDGFDVHWIVQHAQPGPRHAVVDRQIIGDSGRGHDHGVGPLIEPAGHQREQPALPRPAPGKVRIIEKAGGRRALVEDHAGRDARNPYCRGRDEVTQKRHDHIRPRRAQEADELPQAARPRAPAGNHHPHVWRDPVKIDTALTAEQVQDTFMTSRIERAQHRHRHPLGAATGQARDDEADFHTGWATESRVKPSRSDTTLIIAAACRSTVWARAVR